MGDASYSISLGTQTFIEGLAAEFEVVAENDGWVEHNDSGEYWACFER